MKQYSVLLFLIISLAASGSVFAAEKNSYPAPAVPVLYQGAEVDRRGYALRAGDRASDDRLARGRVWYSEGRRECGAGIDGNGRGHGRAGHQARHRRTRRQSEFTVRV